jgi:hypothetical protein
MGKPAGSIATTLDFFIRTVASTVVAIAFSLYVEQRFLPEHTLFTWQRTPYKWSDYAIRILACCIGAGAARFSLMGNRLIVTVALALCFYGLDAPHIVTFRPIDNLDYYPFKGHLPFGLAISFWLGLTVIATVVGSLAGHWIGEVLRRRVVAERHAIQISDRRI